jgi:hypothetical protein
LQVAKMLRDGLPVGKEAERETMAVIAGNRDSRA